MPRTLHVLSYISFFFLILIMSQKASAQRDTIYTDTVNIDESKLKEHSPTKATLYSMVLPGLGQVYNKKYWKVPVIYAGLGVTLYFAYDQQLLFAEKRDAYRQRINGDSSDVFLEFGNFYDNDALLRAMDVNRRNRDLMFILAGSVYVLQIVDAAVDAHLFYFNVSDDLSLHYMPYFNYDMRSGRAQQGISFNLSF